MLDGRETPYVPPHVRAIRTLTTAAVDAPPEVTQSTGKRGALGPTIMRNYFWVLKTELLGRIYAFCSAKHSKPPVDSSGCFPKFSESFLEQFYVSQSLILIFGAANQLTPESQKYDCLSELGPKVMNNCRFIGENYHMPSETGNMDKQSNYDSGETASCLKKLSEN